MVSPILISDTRYVWDLSETQLLNMQNLKGIWHMNLTSHDTLARQLVVFRKLLTPCFMFISIINYRHNMMLLI